MVSSRPLLLNVAPEKELGYGQIFTALLRRKHWLILGLLGGLAVSAVTSLRQPPSYSSGMQVLIEPIYQGKTQGPAKQTDEVTDSNVQVDSATQISFLQSSGLVKKAMLSLQSEYPEYNPDDAGSVTEFKRNLLVIQAASADKKVTTPTKIFQITYQGNNPAKTQKVLSALQKVYLDYNREQQALRLTKGLTFIDQQLPTIGKKLQLSESRLEGFRRNQELIDPKLEAQRQSDQFGKAQDELKTSISQIQELRSRYETLQQQLPMSPAQTSAMGRLTQSTRYQSLLSEIQKTELALVQQRLRFKDGTPYVQQILDQRQQQLSLLQAEAGRVLGASVPGEGLLAAGQLTPQDIATMTQFSEATVALRASEARYSGLQQNVEILRGNLKRFPQLLAEYGRLEPEVELNRDTLKQLLKSRQELGMEIARGSFDWQIVEEPQLGIKTNAPVTQNLMLGAIVGLVLGGAVAFARESMDDAVHTSDDLRQQFSVPLLGMIPNFSGMELTRIS
ncbi:MAG: hypothetical protein LH631_08750 [Alkalinema sp. CAN_BIN05]|nr:hypothetical protein [Alkalinema sp. CAN_BIN05]